MSNLSSHAMPANEPPAQPERKPTLTAKRPWRAPTLEQIDYRETQLGFTNAGNVDLAVCS